MKKMLLSLSLAVMVVCSVSISVPEVCAGKESIESEVADRRTLIYETDVITQEDFEEGFQNYALSSATVDFSSDICTYSSANTTNVVGVVKDYETEEMVAGAIISIDGENVVATGEDGRFQIRHFPSGIYNWQISASGYYTAEYCNYDVDYADGTTIFTFFISEEFAVCKDRNAVICGNESGQSVLHETVDRGDYVVPMRANSMTAPPNVSNWIRVYYNDNVRYVNREQYIYTVLSSEVYSAGKYEEWGLTATQRIEFYMAQAIVANTYVEYSRQVYSNHPNSGYDVCSTSCCQNYDPTKVTQEAINATSYIFYSIGDIDKCDIIMYKPSSTTYSYTAGMFFSGCGNNGTANNPNDPAMNAVSCTDIIYSNANHHYGMCQAGATKLAKDGKSKSEILSYYFTNIEIVTCTMN